MRIGVTGAFGFLGAAFVAELLSSGYRGEPVEVTAFGSRNFSNPQFDPERVRVAALDVLDGPGARRAFAGLDAVAHFAGKVGLGEAVKRPVWDANVVAVQRVLESAADAGVGKFLYVSSASALGPAKPGHPLTEADNPYDDSPSAWSFRSAGEALAAVDRSLAGDYGFLRGMRSVYPDSKLAGLELARRYAGIAPPGPQAGAATHAAGTAAFGPQAGAATHAAGMQVVTIMPGTAVGPGEAHEGIGELVRRSAEGSLRFTVPGKVSYMDSRDFARGARLALERGVNGDEYLLTGDASGNLSFADFMKMAAGTAAALRGDQRRPQAPLVIPKAVALIVAAIAEKLAPSGPLSRGMVLSACMDASCDCGKACRELGYDPGTPLESSIAACLAGISSPRGRSRS